MQISGSAKVEGSNYPLIVYVLSVLGSSDDICTVLVWQVPALKKLLVTKITINPV